VITFRSLLDLSCHSRKANFSMKLRHQRHTGMRITSKIMVVGPDLLSSHPATNHEDAKDVPSRPIFKVFVEYLRHRGAACHSALW
jgi:hypothetical protein